MHIRQILHSLIERSLAEPSKPSGWVRYGTTVFAVAAAYGLTRLVPAVFQGTPFAFFYLAVAISALVGSLRAGVLATLLSSIVVAVWVMPPVSSVVITQTQLVQTTVFFVISGLISWLIYTLHGAREIIAQEREWLRITMGSIADAVIATDAKGNITWMNAVASDLTGWRIADAQGKPLHKVFQIVNGQTRAPVEKPVDRIMAKKRVVGLVNHTVLLAKDGRELPIEESTAPILTTNGDIHGTVLVFHDSSERRARERALQAAEERLRLALEAGRMVAWEWSPNSDQVWSTEIFAEIYGMPMSQHVADVTQLIHPEDRARHQAIVAQAAQGQSYHLEFRIIRPDDGRVVWLEEWARPVVDASGQLQKVVGVAIDVSNRKQAEQALAESERLYRMLAANMPDGAAYVLDTNLRYLLAEGQALALAGMTSSDLEGKTIWEALGAEMAARYEPLYRQALAGQGFYWEHHEYGRDFASYGTPLFHEDGHPHALLAVSYDITQRKQTEAEIHKLNAELDRRLQELQALFDLAPVGIAVAYDRACQVIVVNSTLSQWYGIPKGTNPSKSNPDAHKLPYRLYHCGQELSPDALPMQRSIAEQTTIVNLVLDIVRADGTERTVVASATPLYNDAGEVTGCISTYADITPQKAAEAALQHLNETLEQRVEARTLELEQSNRELDQFAYVASHDLKSPLRGIATLSQWITDDVGDLLPATSKEHLAKIRLRVQRMETLLNDLLAYSRAGRAHYRVEQIDVPAIVRDIVYLLTLPPGFMVAVTEPIPDLMTERVPLETVLRNLISNAAKHHHQPENGHVQVSVRDLGMMLEFCVTDDGPGIAHEFHDRIFGVFQTLRPRDEVEGSGMGLAIVKRLVENKGGVIEVESHPGDGATFRFTWPK